MDEKQVYLWIPTIGASLAFIAGLFIPVTEATYAPGIITSMVLAALTPFLFLFAKSKRAPGVRGKLAWFVTGAIFFAIGAIGAGIGRLSLGGLADSVADIGAAPGWLLSCLCLICMTVLYAVVEIRANQPKDTLRYM